MRFVLAGQPNSGKSTIFNSVAGYRSATANFPGSSVTFLISRALILGREVEVLDLPGIYSLTSSDKMAGKAESFLLDEPYDLIVSGVSFASGTSYYSICSGMTPEPDEAPRESKGYICRVSP